MASASSISSSSPECGVNGTSLPEQKNNQRCRPRRKWLFCYSLDSIWLCLIFLVASYLYQKHYNETIYGGFPILLMSSSDAVIASPSNSSRPAGPDFGGLYFNTLCFPPSMFVRQIDSSDTAYSWYENDRQYQLTIMDDHVEREVEQYDDLDYNETTTCRRPKWTKELHPTCNTFHEMNLQQEKEYHVRYLAHGQYRDTWVFDPTGINDKLELEKAVLKALRLNDDLDYSSWFASFIAREALIMERTTSRSQTMDIYGHCYTSTMVEFGNEISQLIVQGKEYEGRGRIHAQDLVVLQQNDVYPFNNFTKEEKLNIAIQMAEGIAALHGNPDGVIVNDDIHPDQWLVNKDGLVKFNDFNNARFLEWNEITNEYCQYEIWIGGDYRSPEQMKGLLVDEKSDVWPFGANLMGLLSGLFPFYSEWDRWILEERLATGERPFLDPRYMTRSFIEGRLFEIMQACWEENPNERVSIFDVVQHLYDTRDMLQQAKSSGEWISERDDPRPQQMSLTLVHAMFDRKQETNGDDDDDNNDDDDDSEPDDDSLEPNELLDSNEFSEDYDGKTNSDEKLYEPEWSVETNYSKYFVQDVVSSQYFELSNDMHHVIVEEEIFLTELETEKEHIYYFDDKNRFDYVNEEKEHEQDLQNQYQERSQTESNLNNNDVFEDEDHFEAKIVEYDDSHQDVWDDEIVYNQQQQQLFNEADCLENSSCSEGMFNDKVC